MRPDFVHGVAPTVHMPKRRRYRRHADDALRVARAQEPGMNAEAQPLTLREAGVIAGDPVAKARVFKSYQM